MRFARPRAPEKLTVELAGTATEVAVKRHARARRLILRVDAASGMPVLTMPLRASLGQGERFLDRNIPWLQARLGRAAGLPFEDGAVFPLRGEPCRIEHRGGRGLTRLEYSDAHAVLVVPGRAEHLGRRVADWLRRQARSDLSAATAGYAKPVGRAPSKLRIGDARTRWGSCTCAGVLTFSWRLILAPPHVLDYLAAHECAHLIEMNHSLRFWSLVRLLRPDYERSRQWLRRHGSALHGIGRGA